MGARRWGQGRMDLLFNGVKVPILQGEKNYGVDGGDGCATIWIYLILLNCTFSNG